MFNSLNFKDSYLDRVQDLVFPAKLTAKSGSNPILYSWTEQFQKADGTLTDADMPRKGDCTVPRDAARELNNTDVDVSSNPIVWLRRRGTDSNGDFIYEFNTGRFSQLFGYISTSAGLVLDSTGNSANTGTNPNFFWPGYLAAWNVADQQFEAVAGTVYFVLSKYGAVPPFGWNPTNYNVISGGKVFPVWPTGQKVLGNTTPVYVCEGELIAQATSLAQIGSNPPGLSPPFGVLKAAITTLPHTLGGGNTVTIHSQGLVYDPNWQSIINATGNGVLANWPSPFGPVVYRGTYTDNTGKMWPSYASMMPFWPTVGLATITDLFGSRFNFEGGFLYKTSSPITPAIDGGTF